MDSSPQIHKFANRCQAVIQGQENLTEHSLPPVVLMGDKSITDIPTNQTKDEKKNSFQ